MLSDLNTNLYWGVFDSAKHVCEVRISGNKMTEPVNVKFSCFSRKSNQFLDGARSWNMAHLQRDHPN